MGLSECKWNGTSVRLTLAFSGAANGIAGGHVSRASRPPLQRLVMRRWCIVSVSRCTVYPFPAYRAIISPISLVNLDKLSRVSKDLTPWTNDLATTKQNNFRSANPNMQ